MPDFRHVTTVTTGPDSHMIGLGDLLIHEADAGLQLFGASGRGGGVLLREADAGLGVRDVVNYATSAGLGAPRQLQVVDLDGGAVLLAIGRYGSVIEGWQVTTGGLLGSSRPLVLEGAAPGALLALDQTWLNGQHLFITSSRYAPGVQVWVREGDSLHSVAQGGTGDFLAAGTVQALSLAQPGGVAHVLALDVLGHTLTGFALGPGGQLGAPNRLDLRDGLFVGTPTHMDVVQMGNASFAVLGASCSSSITVVALSPDGQMRVTDQVNDTDQTRFQGLVALDVLEADGSIYVLTGGVDNGLTLMTLTPGGRLVHLGSLVDEQREMALQDLSDVEMVWRAGGLDIFVSGAVYHGQTVAGRGITQLRVEDDDGLVPNLHPPSESRIQTGTDAADLFIVNGTGPGDRVVNFEPDRDRLDLSGMGRFYSVEDLQIQSTATGAVIRLGETQVTITTADASRLRADDFEFADLVDLWHIPVTPIAPQQQSGMVLGGRGPDLLDGRAGDDLILGEPRDLPFDDIAAQVFRLYRATLDRDPDFRGLLNWSERLQGGDMDLSEVVAGFTNSPEFRQTYGMTDNRAFVSLLYENVLNRAPDAQGLANWTGRLDRGEMDRSQVVIGFSQSAEFVMTSAMDLKRWMLAQGTDDVLDGGGGDNILMGGLLSDRFVFRQDMGGNHVVADPEPWDRLEFRGFGYDRSADLVPHLSQDGADTVFSDEGVIIRFLDSTVAEIRALEMEF